MKFPGPEFCGDNNQKLMIIGRIPEDGKELPEFAFLSEGIDEAFHLQIDPDNEFLARWAVVANLTTSVIGKPGDGTTIDRDEPFVLRCINLIPPTATTALRIFFRIFNFFRIFWIFSCPDESLRQLYTYPCHSLTHNLLLFDIKEPS